MYETPEIRDYGTLMDLVAGFDATFIGSVAKVVTMAAVSPVMFGGGFDPPGGGVLGDVLGEGPVSGGETGGAKTGPAAKPVGGSGVGGSLLGGAVAPEGGKLPFTGFAAALLALVGAAMTTLGVAVRAKLRRRS